MHSLIKSLVCILIMCLCFQSCKSKIENKTDSNHIYSTNQNSFTDSVSAFYKRVKDVVRSGDIIVRQGNDFTSRSLRSLNRRDKTYSHIGIIKIKNDSIKVLHILGGEWNPDQRVVEENLSSFSSPFENNKLAVYQFPLSNKERSKVITVADSLAKSGVSFDMDFDLKTSGKMYCAEYVFTVLTIATNHRIQIPISHIKEFEFIGVDDIILYQGCKYLTGVDFTKYNIQK